MGLCPCPHPGDRFPSEMCAGVTSAFFGFLNDFIGAFQSSQTVLILFRHIWEEMGESQTCLTCSSVGTRAQVLPSTVNSLPVLIDSISAQPSPARTWIFLLCWAAPSRSFLWPWECSPGFGSCWGLDLAGVVCSGSSICHPWIFFHLEESPGARVVTGGW